MIFFAAAAAFRDDYFSLPFFAMPCFATRHATIDDAITTLMMLITLPPFDAAIDATPFFRFFFRRRRYATRRAAMLFFATPPC